MDRMKQFLIYFLLFVGFIAISIFLENGLINGMYGKLANDKIQTTEQLKDENGNSIISVDVQEAKASRVNGYLIAKIKNLSGRVLESTYAKVELLNNKNRVLATKFIDIKNLGIDEERNYKINFKANDVVKYKFSLMDTLPQEELIRRDSIITFFGHDIDLTNLFGTGINLRDIFGIDLVEKFNLNEYKSVFSWENIKSGASTLWEKGIDFATSIPAWAYFGGLVMIAHFW